MTSATNSLGTRIRNEKLILSFINKETVSCADIAKKTGLTKAAASIIAEDFLKIVREKTYRKMILKKGFQGYSGKCRDSDSYSLCHGTL